MIELGVNIDHVATIRQARRTYEPDPVWAAVEAGASVVDASIGGLGGCPFAPGAAGNVATEDVAYLLARSGVATGLDLDRLIEASHWLGGVMDKAMPSMLARAGGFPKAEQE